MTTIYDVLPTLPKLVRDDFQRARKAPSHWAESWGREMGIYGVNAKGPSGNDWDAGQDDDLDAFRHAFISAIITAWNPLSQFGDVGRTLSELIASGLGNLNEVKGIGKPQSTGKCAKRMDLHNNDVGVGLAPDAQTMLRWLFITGDNPNRKIAEIIAKAVKANKTINKYDDPIMDEDCRKESKIRGKFFRWRTRLDNDVRWEHSIREGKGFLWTGDVVPGQDYGCRCWAEPIEDEK